MLTGRNIAKRLTTIGARLMMVAMLVLCNAFFVRAHGIVASEDARVRVTFPFDNAELRSDYMKNEDALNTLNKLLDGTDGNLEIQIVAYSSPEGNEQYNKVLSARRAATIKSYVLSLFPNSKPSVKVVSYAEAWDQFRAYVAADYSLDASSRSELLFLMDSDNTADEKETLIKADPNYKRLYSKYFRSLRYADISLRIKNIPLAALYSADSKLSSPAPIMFASGSDKVDPNYMDNKARLDEMVAFFRENPSAADDFVILGVASPDGPTDLNNRIALMRAKNMADYIESRVPEVKGKLRIKSAGEDWSGLRAAVLAEDTLTETEKQEICAILDSSASADEKKAALKKHPAYKTVSDKCFSQLRAQSIAPADNNRTSSSSSASVIPVATEDKNIDSSNKDIAAMGVSFRNGSSKLDPTYKDNQKALDEMVAFFRENPSAADEYDIVGAASPDGPTSVNDRLARERAQAIADYISEQAPELKGKLHTKSAGEDWNGLRKAVLAEDKLSDTEKQELCEIIDSEASADEKEAALKNHRSYETVRENCFDALRRQSIAPADSTSKTEKVVVEETVRETVDTTASQDTLYRLERLPEIRTKAVVLGEDSVVEYEEAKEMQREKEDSLANKEYVEVRNMIAAVKTNLLADAITAVNVEVEVPVWENFSLMWELTTPWWETGNKYAFQLLEMGGEIRYWFNPWEFESSEKLRGLFVGPYVMSGIYDFQYKKSLNYQTPHVGRNVEEGFWSAGLTAGFSMPIGREKKMNLEFSLSAGYLHAPYQHYYPADDYSKLYKDLAIGARGNKIYFGPTKAKVSLVVPITIPTGKKKEVKYE